MSPAVRITAKKIHAKTGNLPVLDKNDILQGYYPGKNTLQFYLFAV